MTDYSARLDALQAAHDRGDLIPPHDLRDLAESPIHSKQEAWLNQIAYEQLQRRGGRLRAIGTTPTGEVRGHLLASEQRQVEQHQAAMTALGRVVEMTESRIPAIAGESDRAKYGATETAAIRADDNWLSRAMSTGSDPTGGYMVPPEYSQQFIDRVTAASEALSTLRRITTLKEHVYLPVIDADAAASWTTEAAQITPTDPTFGQLSIPLLKLAALVLASREVLDDSSPELRPIVAMQLERALAKAAETALFEGAGGTEPTAIKDQAGIEEITGLGADGAVPTDLDEISDAITTVVANGANPANVKLFMHPDTWALLLKIKTGTGMVKSIFQDYVPGVSTGFVRAIFGAPVVLTSAISKTETRGNSTGVCSSIYAMDPASVALVVREAARIEVSGSFKFDYDQIAFRAIARLNTKVLTPGHVARIVGVKFS